jgi:hypothetical protein
MHTDRLMKLVLLEEKVGGILASGIAHLLLEHGAYCSRSRVDYPGFSS